MEEKKENGMSTGKRFDPMLLDTNWGTNTTVWLKSAMQGYASDNNTTVKALLIELCTDFLRKNAPGKIYEPKD